MKDISIHYYLLRNYANLSLLEYGNHILLPIHTVTIKICHIIDILIANANTPLVSLKVNNCISRISFLFLKM